MRRVSLFAALALLFCLAAATAQAAPTAPAATEGNSGRRLALVIGNGAYKAAPLKNPANDARDMAAALKSLGFSVTLLTDAGHKQMESAVREFGLALRQGGTGLFYFAGHGIQVAGENYLVPVDAVIQTESDVKFGCLSAGLVLGKMEDARNDLNIVVLDACRNNPFGRGFRGAEQGLAKMDAPTGSLIAYATAPGSVAADGAGRNGVYTENLLKNMRTPGLPITDVFMRTRMGVVAATAKKQVPWESSSLTGYFYFSGSGQAQAPDPPASPTPAIDMKAEKQRVAEEAARLKREKEELAQLTALQAEKGRLEAERLRIEQAKLLAMAPRPKEGPKASPPGKAAPAASHAAQLAQLARAGLPDARAYFEQAIQLRPEDGEARAGLAMALVFAGREADAKYQVQRLDDAGAQGPAARLARGLLLGLAGNADSQYQFSRAEEEGVDRALALLCRATVAERQGDNDGAAALVRKYEGLVPQAERGDYPAALAARVDTLGRLEGVYRLVGRSGADPTVTFRREGGVLLGSGSGSFGVFPVGRDVEDIAVTNRTIQFAIHLRGGILPDVWHLFTCEISSDFTSLSVIKSAERGRTDSGYEEAKSAPFRGTRFVRQAAAQP